jgi:pyruvate dehydrogenase E1 component alpha subunit
MPRTAIHEAVTERLEILAPDGTVDEDLMPVLEREQVEAMYSQMVFGRELDAKAIRLQRQGRMGTWASLRGQEAVQVGAAAAMTDEDWLVPAFREHVAMIERGVPGHLLLSYWAGDERGSAFPDGVRVLPVPVPVGSQFPHGVGVGMSLSMRGEHACAVTFIGDGATSEGDFHEALNFAGVFKAKTVFIVQNNQWAISVPLSQQTASETIAQRGWAYGFPGIQVDGNDLFAVYSACREAFERARSGGGPTLIEAVTYRLGDHTTADDASRYRSDDEVADWKDRDPIDRLRRFMEARGWWDDRRQEELEARSKSRVEEMVAAMQDMSPQPPSAIFEYMYQEMPPNLREQMQELSREVAE